MAQALVHPVLGAVSIMFSPKLPSAGMQKRVKPVVPIIVCAFRDLRMSKFQLNAVPGSVMGVEPDLSEETLDLNMTAGEDREDEFPFGKADGAHTWHEGDHDVGFIEGIQIQIEESGGPATDPGQNAISWLYLPGIFAAMAFGVKTEYLCAACVLFIFAFIGIEMAKPDKPSNFEPEISRLDRGMKKM